MVFSCGSLAYTRVRMKGIRKWNFLTIWHIERDEQFTFGIRQRAVLDVTLDCSFRWCKVATQSTSAENLKTKQRKSQNATPTSRALQYQKVAILLLHIAVKCLSGHPSVSRLVCPMLRLLVINAETSGDL